MKRFAIATALALPACSGATPSSAPDTASSGSSSPATFVCQPTPTCGGAYTGDWTIDDGCSVAAVPLAGCGTFEIDFAAATGSFSFDPDGLYSASVDLGPSAELSLPSTCKGVKSCNAFDSALLACTGDPSSGCACKGIAVTESGTYVAASGILELTPKGVPILKTVGSFCASGDSIEIVVANAVVLRGTKK